MNEFLVRMRRPVFSPISQKLLHSILILLAGIVLGTIAKMLDETASNLLPSFIEMLDLRNFFSRMGFWLFSGVCIAIYSKTPLRAALNVFLYFAGMVSSYYVYTIQLAGFFPKSYMIIWINMAILSPLVGAVCWYAKGTHPVSLCLSAVILMMMERQTFSFGFWYFDVRYVLELFLLFLTIVVLYRTPKQILVVSGAGILLFFITAPLNLFWGMSYLYTPFLTSNLKVHYMPNSVKSSETLSYVAEPALIAALLKNLFYMMISNSRIPFEYCPTHNKRLYNKCWGG